MITIESLGWREKVSDALLHLYSQALANGDGQIHQIVVDYKGDIKRFPDEVEVLSVIDGCLQVNIRMPDLPLLASKSEISRLQLPRSA
jgi:hypothetical protein